MKWTVEPPPPSLLLPLPMSLLLRGAPPLPPRLHGLSPDAVDGLLPPAPLPERAKAPLRARERVPGGCCCVVFRPFVRCSRHFAVGEKDETCPVSTGRRTRRVQLVQEGGGGRRFVCDVSARAGAGERTAGRLHVRGAARSVPARRRPRRAACPLRSGLARGIPAALDACAGSASSYPCVSGRPNFSVLPVSPLHPLDLLCEGAGICAYHFWDCDSSYSDKIYNSVCKCAAPPAPPARLGAGTRLSSGTGVAGTRATTSRSCADESR